jgi:hypothetical protein
MRQLHRLETDLTNLLMAELGADAKSSQHTDPDGFPLIEMVLLDDAATTTKFERTAPYPRHSAIYERIDIVAGELGTPRTKRGRRQTTRALIARDHDAAYEWIEVARPSRSALSSGSLEAAWFVSPDDAVAPAEQDMPRDHRFLIAAAIAFAAALLTVLAFY